MDNQLKITLSQLKDGQSQAIDLKLDPSFLEVDEPELAFKAPVEVNGEAYLAGDELIIHLTTKTVAVIPCRICSEPVEVPVNCEGVYHTVPLDEIKGNEYPFQDVIRENLLIEVPAFIECSANSCPKRDQLKKYFKQNDGNESHEDGHQPFKNLSL